jgi:hypothetical protein
MKTSLEPVQLGPGLRWPAGERTYCPFLDNWMIVGATLDFPLGGVLPCNICHGIHQVIRAGRNRGLFRLLADQVRVPVTPPIASASRECQRYSALLLRIPFSSDDR